MDKWLRNPNVARVVALAVAVILWSVVRLDKDRAGSGATGVLPVSQVIYNVRVVPLYDESRYAIREMSPSEVTLRIDGRVGLTAYRVVVDLRNAGAGEHTITPRVEGVPGGARVAVEPASVKVVLEEKKSMEVAVRIAVRGAPADGYRVGEPVVSPGRVLVTAPESRLGEVDVVQGEISVEGADRAVKKDVRLTAYDQSGRVVDAEIAPQVVSVEIPVTLPFKNVPVRVDIGRPPPDGYAVASVVPEIREVTLFGPERRLEAIEFYAVPALDLSGMTVGGKVTVELPAPEGVERIKPDRLTIAFDIVAAAERTIGGIPLLVSGQNRDYDTRIAEPAGGFVSVRVEGAPALLERLRPEDVQAVVDVSNLPPGVHDVTVRFYLPPFIERIGPEAIARIEIAEKRGGNGSPSPAQGSRPSGSPEV